MNTHGGASRPPAGLATMGLLSRPSKKVFAGIARRPGWWGRGVHAPFSDRSTHRLPAGRGPDRRV